MNGVRLNISPLQFTPASLLYVQRSPSPSCCGFSKRCINSPILGSGSGHHCAHPNVRITGISDVAWRQQVASQ